MGILNSKQYKLVRKNNQWYTPSAKNIKPFNECTWKEVAWAMDQHYNHGLDLRECWNVGDEIILKHGYMVAGSHYVYLNNGYEGWMPCDIPDLNEEIINKFNEGEYYSNYNNELLDENGYAPFYQYINGQLVEIGRTEWADFVKENHNESQLTMRIIGFEHDDLVEPINNHTKAHITLESVYSMADLVFNEDKSLVSNTAKPGYMYGKSPTQARWDNCNRKLWCDYVFPFCLEPYAKKIVKAVKKTNLISYNSTQLTSTSSNSFILSIGEKFSTIATGSSAGNPPTKREGSIYEYWSNKTNSNRITKVGINSGKSDTVYLRTPTTNSSYKYYFMCINDAGNSVSINSTLAKGIVPAFCI